MWNFPSVSEVGKLGLFTLEECLLPNVCVCVCVCVCWDAICDTKLAKHTLDCQVLLGINWLMVKQNQLFDLHRHAHV